MEKIRAHGCVTFQNQAPWKQVFIAGWIYVSVNQKKERLSQTSLDLDLVNVKRPKFLPKYLGTISKSLSLVKRKNRDDNQDKSIKFTNNCIELIY